MIIALKYLNTTSSLPTTVYTLQKYVYKDIYSILIPKKMKIMIYTCNYYFHNIFNIVYGKSFKGWGRKRTGLFALWCYKTFGGELMLNEDGFIRSLGLGIQGSSSFSIVDDAMTPSRLEYILNTYNFIEDNALMSMAKKAIHLIQQHNVSKYNNAPDIETGFFNSDTRNKVLIIAQTVGDASLKYGAGEIYSTKQMIDDAIRSNPNMSIYIKIHPDALTGKKVSDISEHDIPPLCTILDNDINPISLLKYFDKVYTKTSGMGMEALILGLDVVCYGIPYYSGWGLTEDKQKCARRKRVLSLEELFAGAYILYTKYHNPHNKKISNIIDTIYEILEQKHKGIQN